MAKKKVPQEKCMFCDEQPCLCSATPQEKALRQQHANPTRTKPDESDK